MKNTIAILFFYCFSYIAFGQVVNIEQKRIVTDSAGWAGSAEAEFLFNKEVATQYSLSGSLHVQYKTNKSLFLVFASMTDLTSEDRKLINSGFQHLRYNVKLNDSFLRWEAFAQHQHNEILKIDHRILVGTGPRFKILPGEKLKLYFGPLYMVEYEEVDGKTEINRDHRLSTYLSGTWSPSETLTLSSTCYFQPRLDEFRDYRTAGEVRFEADITKRLKFTTAFIYANDKFPLPGIPEETYRMTNGLSYEF